MLALLRPACRFPNVESLLPANSSSLPSPPPPRLPITRTFTTPLSSIASPPKYSLVFSTVYPVTFRYLRLRRPHLTVRPKRGILVNAAAGFHPPHGQPEWENFSQASKRLRITSKKFKHLGHRGFWWQLVLTVEATVILSFSTFVSGKVNSPVTFYAIASSIAAAFISVFRSFCYKRLSESLWRTANQPSKSKTGKRVDTSCLSLTNWWDLAPPFADVVKSLKNNAWLNIFGMVAAIFGILATVGPLVIELIASPELPHYQSTSPGQSPMVVLDIFLVQTSANLILSHFMGLLFSLGMLKSVILDPVSIPEVGW